MDLSYHVILDRGWRPPDNARSAVTTLGERGLLDAAVAARLGRAAGLRNVLVHEYVRVDLETLARTVNDHLTDLRAFAVAAARWMEASP
jgi:uncharacterized protein YutE (UPF0331/DUF86 family)